MMFIADSSADGNLAESPLNGSIPRPAPHSIWKGAVAVKGVQAVTGGGEFPRHSKIHNIISSTKNGDRTHN
jgi:hypothetical protein